MQMKSIGAAAVLCACLTAPVAHATLAITSGANSNVHCVAYTCTATAPNAVIGVSRLRSWLAAHDVTLISGPAGDIDVQGYVAWASAQSLTLDSSHSIRFEVPLKVQGDGGLTLVTNDGGSGGTLSFAPGGNITFWSLSDSLTINGKSYTLVNSVAGLAGAVSSNPSGNVALASDYDATADGSYGAAPVPVTFGGAFEGLGHTLSYLAIRNATNTGNIGLFAQLASTGAIENLSLSHLVVIVKRPAGSHTVANIGGLVGLSYGAIRNIGLASGYITGASGYYPRGGQPVFESVGGLAGISDGDIVNVTSTLKVSAVNDVKVGGLVGSNDAGYSGSISQSLTSGDVTIKGYVQTDAGGLIGYFGAGGSIDQCSSSGGVTNTSSDGVGAAGGLAGIFFGATISASHATGDVAHWNGGGGLIGYNTGTIADSYATGNVTGSPLGSGSNGGLVSSNQGTITRSFATGSVTSIQYARAGGLVGDNSRFMGSAATITDSYATGAVTVGMAATGCGCGGGGLVGTNTKGTINTSYATGSVTAGSGNFAGGLVGYDEPPHGTFNNAYWDTTTSGITSLSQGAGNIANDSGITGLSDAALKSGLPTGFSVSVWAEDSGINGGLPYLIANPPG